MVGLQSLVRVWLVVALVVGNMAALWPAPAQARAVSQAEPLGLQGDVTLDGQRDAAYGALIADDEADDLAGTPEDINSGPGAIDLTAWADLTALYCAHDGSNLYVYADLPDYRQDTSTGQIGLLIDKFTAGGGAQDPWDNAIFFEQGEKPDFVVRGHIPGSKINGDIDSGLTALAAWSGSDWTNTGENWGGLNRGEQVGSKIAYRDNTGVEIKIPFGDIGIAKGDSVQLAFFATEAGDTKGAYDTVPTDEQAGGWDEPTTLSEWAVCELDVPQLYVTPSHAAPGAQLRIGGMGFVPNSTVQLLIPAEAGDQPLGSATVDAQGVLRGRYTVPDVPAADYSVRAVTPGGATLASAPLTIGTGLVLQLDPESGPPGTTIQYTVENARPGTLRIVFGGVPVLYDVPVGEGTATGSFVVPFAVDSAGVAISAADANVSVEATNYVYGASAGRATRTFSRGAAPNQPTYTLENIQFSSTDLAPGDLFTVNGTVNPPPVGSLDQYQIHVLFRDQAGKSIPIGLDATLQQNGTFEATAQWPSLLRGMTGSQGGEIGVVLASDSGAPVVSVEPIVNPNAPVLRIQVVGVDGDNKTPIKNAIVRTEFLLQGQPKVPGEPGYVPPGTNKVGGFELLANDKHQLGSVVTAALYNNGAPDPFACKNTDLYGRTDSNGIFAPKYDWERAAILGSWIPISNGWKVVGYEQYPETVPIPIEVNAGYQGFGPVQQDGTTVYETYVLYNGVKNRFYDPVTLKEVDTDPLVIELPKLPAGAKPSIPIEPEILAGVPQNTSGLTYGAFVSLAAAVNDPAITFKGDSKLQVRFQNDPQVAGSLDNIRFFVDNSPVGTFSQPSKGSCAGTALYSYSWTGVHLLSPGPHTLRIVADSAVGTVTKDFGAYFVGPPNWFLDSSYANRVADLTNYQFGSVRLSGSQVSSDSGGNTAIGAKIDAIGGDLNNSAASSSRTEQVLNFTGDNTVFQTGGTEPKALNQSASPQSVSKSGAYTVKLPDIDTVLFESGWMPLYRNQWGVWPIATATVGADLWFKATYRQNGYISIAPATGASESFLHVEPEANVKVKAWFNLSAIFGLVEAGISAIPSIVVSMPIEFTNGSKSAGEVCFRYRLDMNWWGKVGECPACKKDSGTKNIFAGIEPPDKTICQAKNPGGVRAAADAAVAADEPPPFASPTLATDGMGSVAAVWATDDGNIESAIYDDAWIFAVLDESNASIAPSVTYYAPGKGVVVWAENTLKNAPSSTLTETVKAQQLVYATVDGHTWSEGTPLTTPTTGDGGVAVAACHAADPACPSGGAVTAVWVHDMVGAFSQRQLRLYYATYKNGAWSAAQPVDNDSTAADTSPAVVYFKGKPVVFWVRDADRSLATIDDQRLVYRVLDGSPVRTPNAFPAGAETPSVAVDGDQIAVALVVAHDATAYLGNQRTLYSAETTCPTLAGCTWSVKQLKDVHGRPLRAETPQIMFDQASKPVITFRGLGFGPTPAGTLQAFVGDPLGMLQGTGEMAQVEAGQALAYHNPTYMTNNGLVNWQTVAVYEPVGQTVWSIAVQPIGSAQAAAQQGQLQASSMLTAQGMSAEVALPTVNLARLPDFVVDMMALPPFDAAAGFQVDVRVRNQGVAATGPVDLVVSQDGGYGIGTTLGSGFVPALGAGEATTVTVDLISVGNYAWAHTLVATVNPALTVDERTIANNTASLAAGGLTPPTDLTMAADAYSLPIFLSWTAANDARITGYRVYRSTDDGPFEPLGVSDVTGYADLQAEPGYTYSYRVTGFDVNGEESPMTESVSVALLSVDGISISETNYLPLLINPKE